MIMPRKKENLKVRQSNQPWDSLCDFPQVIKLRSSYQHPLIAEEVFKEIMKQITGYTFQYQPQSRIGSFYVELEDNTQISFDTTESDHFSALLVILKEPSVYFDLESGTLAVKK